MCSSTVYCHVGSTCWRFIYNAAFRGEGDSPVQTAKECHQIAIDQRVDLVKGLHLSEYGAFVHIQARDVQVDVHCL